MTTITETKPLPTPDGASSRQAARSFVAAYERRYVYNELVDGVGGSQPAIEITVEPSRVAPVHATDRGYYFLSSCRGSARHYDPDGSPNGGRPRPRPRGPRAGYGRPATATIAL